MLVVLLGIVIVLLCMSIKIVPESEVWIIERFGKYNTALEPGLSFVIPIIDRVRRRVSLKETVLDFKPQPVITKDNVTMMIDSVVYMKVMNPVDYTYKISNPKIGVETLSATTLRSLVGEMDFDTTLSARDTINVNLLSKLDEATDPWGIKITRVEVKNIMPPKDIQEVMQKQMTAERNKRQAITEAEAHKQSVVMIAEGDKQAKVLAAQAEADALVAQAKGEAEATTLKAKAQAEALSMLTSAEVSPEVLRLKGYDALRDVANGNASKIFIPTELMNTVGEASLMGEGFKSAFKEGAPKRKPRPDLAKDPHDDVALAPREESQLHKDAVATANKDEFEHSQTSDTDFGSLDDSFGLGNSNPYLKS